LGTLATGGLTSAYTKGNQRETRNQAYRRQERGLLIACAALSAAGLLLTAAPGAAAAADAQQGPGLIAKAAVSSSQGVTAQAARIPDRATALCIPGVNGYNRFFSCVPLTGEVIFYVEENGVEEPVGDITFEVEQTVELAVKSTTSPRPTISGISRNSARPRRTGSHRSSRAARVAGGTRMDRSR